MHPQRMTLSKRRRCARALRGLAAAGVLPSALVLAATLPVHGQLHAPATSGQSALGEPHLTRVQFLDAGNSFFVDDIMGEADVPLPVSVQLPNTSQAPGSVLVVKGLPADFSLSVGRKASDTWTIPAEDAYRLYLIPPKNFNGNFELEIQLKGARGAPADARRVWVDIGPKRIIANAPTQATEQPTPGARGDTARKASPDTVSPDEEQALIARAEKLLASNDIAAARLIFTRLAKRGSSKGALAMAQSYDPAFLSRFNIAGLKPDMEKARYWYSLAADHGSEDASRRLIALTKAPE
jgi:hypothetical protein